jgi:AcrR family transcriptional regulator
MADEKARGSGVARNRAAEPKRVEGSTIRNSRTTLSKIRSAAVEEFGSVGFGRSNVDRIARLAGVTKQLIYHYYPRKKELYADAVNSFAHNYFTCLLEADFDQQDPNEAITQFARRLADFYTANRAVAGLVIDQSLPHGKLFKGGAAEMRLRAQLLDRLDAALARSRA